MGRLISAANALLLWKAWGLQGDAEKQGGVPGQLRLVCCQCAPTGKITGSYTRYFMKKISCQMKKSGVTLVFETVGRKKLEFRLNGKPNRKLI